MIPTDQQITDLGIELAADPTCHGMERGEGFARRPLTNIEMHAILAHARAEKWRRIERDGCCGGEAMPDGFCFGIGVCPLHGLKTKGRAAA
jgi:hypothetical protein